MNKRKYICPGCGVNLYDKGYNEIIEGEYTLTRRLLKDEIYNAVEDTTVTSVHKECPFCCMIVDWEES